MESPCCVSGCSSLNLFYFTFLFISEKPKYNAYFMYVHTMLYKITHNLVAINPDFYISSQTSLTRHRHTYNLQYKPFSTSTDYIKFSFLPHTIVIWNAFMESPCCVSGCSSLNLFYFTFLFISEKPKYNAYFMYVH
jgi:hypothetical protein